MSLTDIACSKWSCKSRPQHSTFRSQPRRSLRGANSGLEGSRMTSWTDALWNWSHSCDLLRHLWSAFLFEWNDISVTLRWTPCNLSNCHTFLWKTQENAQMVNRILSVGPTFNRKVEARFPVPLLSKPTAENCWMSFLIACETVKGWQTHTQFEWNESFCFVVSTRFQRRSVGFLLYKFIAWRFRPILRLKISVVTGGVAQRFHGKKYKKGLSRGQLSDSTGLSGQDFVWILRNISIQNHWTGSMKELHKGCGHSSDRFFGCNALRIFTARAAQNLQRFVDRGTLPHKWGTQLLFLDRKRHPCGISE